MKTLILTEKPSVAKDFAQALKVHHKSDGYMTNNKYIITWAIGHLVELLEPDDYDERWKKWKFSELPIIPEDFRYKAMSKTQKQLMVIKKLLDQPLEMIVIATDAGREGEVIARSIFLFLDFKKDVPLKRFWTSQALTPEVVRKGMQTLEAAQQYDRLWKAGQSRQIADWLVGMNCSRAATLKMNDRFSGGRVQTAVLGLLVDRRRTRENFKSEPYWILKTDFSNHAGKWRGVWFKGKVNRFKTEQHGRQIEQKISQVQGIIQKVTKRRKKQKQPPLYSLTDLQRDANAKFGFTAQKTLNIAQELYEREKCLSYPRTDAKVLGSKSVSLARILVQNLSPVYPQIFAGVDQNLIKVSNKRVFNDAKLTDHHALIPLKAFTGKGATDKIYFLVLKRFAAAFHPDCEFEQTEVITEVDKETFRTHGRIILKSGWQKVYTGDQQEEQSRLPALVQGDPAKVEATQLETKKTMPAPEYTEGFLLKDMINPGKYVDEDELKKIYRGETGLGTQSTRAQIIETLVQRNYIKRTQKNLTAVDKGCLLIETLRRFKTAAGLTSAEKTAQWEKELNQIAAGKGSDQLFLEDIKKFIKGTIMELSNSKKSLGTCPQCGGVMIEGRRGFGCSNWKAADGACRFIIWKNISGRSITPQMAVELLATKKTRAVKGFISEQQECFAGILEIVKNDHWEVKLERTEEVPPSDCWKCPLCNGSLIESPQAYGCANWKDNAGGCKFTIWKTMAGKEIKQETANYLLENGRTDQLEGFKSKKGNLFATKLKLEYNQDGDLVVVFDFD